MWADSTLCSERQGNESLISTREFYLCCIGSICSDPSSTLGFQWTRKKMGFGGGVKAETGRGISGYLEACVVLQGRETVAKLSSKYPKFYGSYFFRSYCLLSPQGLSFFLQVQPCLMLQIRDLRGFFSKLRFFYMHCVKGIKVEGHISQLQNGNLIQTPGRPVLPQLWSLLWFGHISH